VGIGMQKEPICALCGGQLVRESNVPVTPGLSLFFSLAWVCTRCSVAYSDGDREGHYRVPCESLFQDGKRVGDQSGTESA
jgi:hypothetical protein